ncbi:hypothetical protein [Bifidobacterium sp. ESL0790]|uniref:hypothetical protein n=1 Tax=Bifidobacterium sp. ESL0790 TaxID=2983233 RepID=UPI0023F817F3|nr:hypothetical protein [Bifidobacterium sp. ESL0790]WEV72362.1 hypothetical protein OZY47_08080 [Bifidobacterium sp. ESL0790]
MKNGYLDFDDFPPDVAEMLRKDVEEAERGYTDEQLKHARIRHPGRPLAVGSTRADTVIRVRLDKDRKNALKAYMKKHHIMTLSTAVRQLLDTALAAQ